MPVATALIDAKLTNDKPVYEQPQEVGYELNDPNQQVPQGQPQYG